MTAIKMKGTGRAILTKENGEKTVYEHHNLITTAGFNFLIKSIISGTGRPNVLSHIAIGTGTTAANVSQTALVSETNRGAGTWTWSEGSKTFKITTAFDRGAVSGTITEGAVFNAATGGTMFDRVVFATPITVGTDVQYTQEFEFEVI